VRLLSRRHRRAYRSRKDRRWRHHAPLPTQSINVLCFAFCFDAESMGVSLPLPGGLAGWLSALPANRTLVAMALNSRRLFWLSFR